MGRACAKRRLLDPTTRCFSRRCCYIETMPSPRQSPLFAALRLKANSSRHLLASRHSQPYARSSNASLCGFSQIQDIAGARIVTEGGLDTQDQIRDAVVAAFPGARVFDRRERPSYGYRAVHVVVTCQAVPVEIQIRTSDQHRWAEIFERLADTFGRQIRYGGEPDEPNADFFGITHRDVIELMMVLSEVISSKEYVLSTMGMKHDVHELLRQVATRWPRTDFPRAEAEAVRLLRARETGLAPLNAELDAMLDALSRLVEPR